MPHLQNVYIIDFSVLTMHTVIVSHTRTVVRECYKDDCESLWKSLKFDPSPCKNGLTDRPPNLHRLLCPGYLPQCKILCRSDQGFFLPIWVKYNSTSSASVQQVRNWRALDVDTFAADLQTSQLVTAPPADIEEAVLFCYNSTLRALLDKYAPIKIKRCLLYTSPSPRD